MSDELQAGPEIDARIAAEVMQWVRVSNDDTREDGVTTFMVYRGEKVLKGTPYKMADGDDFYDHSFEAWSPSTDISAAYQMEERIKELGLEGVYSIALADYTGCIDAQKQGERETDLLWRLIHASTLDRCKAALSACSGLKPDVATAQESTK